MEAPALSHEIQRRQSNTAKVIAHFRQHQGEWVDSRDLERLGGRLAWRTRVSNARKVFCAELGWTFPIPKGVGAADPILDRQYEVGDVTVSEYRYWPFVVVGQPTTPSPEKWTIPGAPWGPEPFELTP